MRSLALPAVVLAGLSGSLAAGCDDRAGAPQTPDREVVDGVENLFYPAARAEPLGWTFDTLAVIGDILADDPAYVFDRVSPAGLAGDEEHVYVLDGAGRRVLKYTLDGRHVASYGARGGGPGELEQPFALDVDDGGDLWAVDLSNRRIVVFSQRGGPARDLAFPEEIFLPNPSGFAVRGGSYLLAQFPRPSLPGFTPEPAADPVLPLLRLTPEGRIDTLWTVPQPTTDRVERGGAGTAIMMATARAFTPQFQWRALSDGSLVVSDTAEYVLHLAAPDGSVVRRIRRDPPARAATEADRERARQRMREQSGGRMTFTIQTTGSGGGAAPATPNPEALREAMIESMTFEPVIPRVVRIGVDSRDRVWVGVSEETPETVERIDVYDRDGTLLGELRDVPFPHRFFGPDLAALITTDDFDVQRVMVLRLRED